MSDSKTEPAYPSEGATKPGSFVGLSKREYAAVEIAAVLAGRSAEDGFVIERSVKLADKLFEELEK